MTKTILISSITILLGATSNMLAAQNSIELSAASRTALGIETVRITASDSYTGATTNGVVIAPPDQIVNIVSPFDAIMLQPLVMPGVQVTAGQSMAILQSSDFAAAQADLESLELDAEHMTHLAKRTEELQKLGLKSDEESEEAWHEAKASDLRLRAIKAKLASVTPADSSNQYLLSSNSGGIVAHINAKPSDPVNSTSPVITLFRGQVYWASAQLPERLADTITLGSVVTIVGSAENGVVIAIDPEVDQDSRSLEILVELPQNSTWRLGQLIDLAFNVDVPGDSLFVPARSIVQIDGSSFVFVQNNSGFDVVPVEIVSRGRDIAVILGDLSTESSIAISGLAALKNLLTGA